jgi:sec-independent protein translocase protein TatC
MAAEDEHNQSPSAPEPQPGPAGQTEEVSTSSHSQTVDDSYGYNDDPYAHETNTAPAVMEQAAAPPASPPPPPPVDEEDMEEEGMLRMSFLDHLEELRTRILRALYGLGIAFLVSLVFANQLWNVIREPARDALTQLGVNPPNLAQITPMEAFSTIYVKLPLLTAVFLGSPWVLFQVWAFIAPGLYRRERRWAAPFVIISAGLFIAGGLFAYFVAFRFGLVFLLGIGRNLGVTPLVSITEYFDLFVNVTLGIGLVFEMPVLIFFLTLLRIASPPFLIRHSRYAILAIVVLAAIITPTPDIFNLMIFAVPMVLLYFVGIFASYLLVLSRENRRFPWKNVILAASLILAAAGGMIVLAIFKYGYQVVPRFPFLVR